MSRLEAVQALVAQDPANSRIRYMLCMEFISARDFPAAVAELKELLARDPNYVAAYYQAGRASEEAGEEDAARAFYRDGIATAKLVNDNHALSELQAALDILGDF
jgi:predicted Zn-dependent protease